MGGLHQHKTDHLLTKVDARVKLLSMLVLLLMVLTNGGYTFPVLVALFSLSICVWMRIPVKLFVLRFSEPAFIALMVVLIKFLFTGKDVIFSVDIFGIGIQGHRDGLMDGLLIAARIAGAVSLVALLGFSTPFAEMMAALSWMKVPRAFVEILMFAYRYLFVLFEDALVIYNAQKNRLGYSSLRRGLRSFGVLSGSLVLKAFDSSQHTATAMLQRGYDGNMPMLKHKEFRPVEIAVSLALLVIMGVAWRL